MEKEEEAKKTQMEEIYGAAPKIDLSKIKNVEAINKVGNKEAKDIALKAEVSRKKQTKAKFCFTEEYEVELPTGGVLYQDLGDEDLKNGIVKIKPMSVAEEEIIANQTYINNGSVFRHLLNSCIVNEFDAKDLVPYDVYYLIYALRHYTYGEEYSFDVSCDECGKQFPFSLNIADVEFPKLDKEETKWKTIKFPVSKYSALMRCTVLGDEEELLKLKKTKDYGDTVLALTLRTREVFDEEGNPINPKDFPDFFQALPGRDRGAITKAFENIDGLEIPKVTCECPHCGGTQEMAIPFTKEFFRY